MLFIIVVKLAIVIWSSERGIRGIKKKHPSGGHLVFEKKAKIVPEHYIPDRNIVFREAAYDSLL